MATEHGVLREFVLALRQQKPVLPLTGICTYCLESWELLTEEHHTDGCVWAPRITEALATDGGPA